MNEKEIMLIALVVCIVACAYLLRKIIQKMIDDDEL